MKESAWAFTIDGHVFYVLNTVGPKSLVYDFASGHWYVWFTAGRPFWNMFRGVNWRGHVVAADAEGPQLWTVDPYSDLDEGVYPIERTVTGFLPLRGKGSVTVGTVQLGASVGVAREPVDVSLRFSDDDGDSWSAWHPVTLEPDNFAQRVQYRSLGRIRPPGRIWELRDTGGLVRIDKLTLAR